METTGLFRLAQIWLGWEQNRMRVRYNHAHHHGLFALVERRGRLAALQDQALARMISSHDLAVARQELRAPSQPFAQFSDIVSLTSD